MDRADYEWHYFIGGDMAIKRRKYGEAIAYIYHIVQNRYEALVYRGVEKDPWSLGIYCSPNEAQEAVEQALESAWEK